MKLLVEVLDNNEKVELSEVINFLMADEETGAVSLYVGIVKGVKNGKRVRGIEYRDDGRGAERLRRSVEEAVSGKRLKSVFVVHYRGFRRPGDIIMLVGVSAESRWDAFETVENIVNGIKRSEPLKKFEILEE